VEKLESFKFLGVHITDKLKWSTRPDTVLMKGQQLLFNLRRMKKCGCHLKPSQTFTDAQLRESSRAVSPPGMATAPPCNRRTPQRVVWSAQRITRGKLPALQDTNSTRCHRKVKKIIKDNNPSHCLFTPYHPECEVSTGESKLGPRD
jgi:hypothetical protein